MIPDEQLVLLEIAEPWLGVYRATQELLREINHQYVGWPQALADLHRYATDVLHRHVAHPRGAEGIAVMSRLYERVATEAVPEEVASDGLRLWLRYLEKVSSADGGDFRARRQVVEASLARVQDLLEGAPWRAVGVIPQLERLVAALAHPEDATTQSCLDRALGALGRALLESYRGWAEDEDPLDWYESITGPSGGNPPPELLAISRARMRDLAGLVERLVVDRGARAQLSAQLSELPDHAAVQRGYLDAARAVASSSSGVEALQDELHWLLRVLGHDRLAEVHESALREVTRCCSDLIEAAGGEGPVHEVFGLLREGGFPFTRGVDALVGQVGRQALSAGDPELAETLIDEMLSLDFDYPEFSGFTSEWGVVVNPDHLRRIRTYLSVARADPPLAGALIAGLVVHLRLGGVFMADTDLFQRDVSALLARPVGPVYLETKQFLRLAPVYFNEIGAEGALRETSTRLDEMSERRDALCHFLRKQSHVESNPRLIALAEEIARYWLTGEPRPLRGFVPAEVMETVDPGDPERLALSEVVGRLAGLAGGLDELLTLDPAEVERLAGALGDFDARHREKVVLLLSVRREIARKYAIDDSDLTARLLDFRSLDAKLVRRLGEALAAGDDEAALDHVLTVLETLQRIILAPGETEAYESIYRKRHIAAGIPSMYGSYREERFEAMGLTFRAGSLASALLERVVRERVPTRVDPEALHEAAGLLRLHLRALRIDGFRAQGLELALRMLGEGLRDPSTTSHQYLNVFQIASHRIEDMVRARLIDAYALPIERIVPRMVERGVLSRPDGTSVQEAALVHSEALLRDLIADSLGLQSLDSLVGRMIRLFEQAPRGAAPLPPARLDMDDSIVRIDGPTGHHDVLSLGNKGLMLRRLARVGVRVPAGCILTTQLHRGREVLWRSSGAREALARRLSAEVALIERSTGMSFGDPARPLLLSVRSGAAISMPGMLETFLNVGMTHEIAEGMARTPGRDWAAWDANRRFLQAWGMAHGMEREVFDTLIAEGKRRHGVERKALLPATAMREVAFAYYEALAERGAVPPDDPLAQLVECVRLVQDSWESERARIYRAELHISDDWATAVIVQRMVFGNLGQRSGAGVLFTRHPRHESRAVELYGDFVTQSQGDDVVGGLVETFPLSELQRRALEPPPPRSLEADFPEIHAALEGMARRLVEEEGMNHQEVEFTFESDREEDLYVLQTRDTVVAPPERLLAFEPTEALDASRIGAGIGVGGGAQCGRIAHSAKDIEELRVRWPEDPIILVRRDTVPEDVSLLLRADGMLTALGGATSHAAVAAKRLGKACVVGCPRLVVHEGTRASRLGERLLATGDRISIDGRDGSVYLGVHPVTPVRTGKAARVLSNRREGA